MGKKVFTVELYDNKVVYHGGETVSGQLDFDNNEPFDIDLVEVSLSGKAFVHWTEGSGKNSQHYRGKEKLIKEKVPVSGSSGSQKTLPSGRSTFPFAIALPQELPSSIEVPGGYVRYSLKGLIKRPRLHSNLRTKLLFTVLDILDLNQVPHAKHSSSESDSKNLCCWCCSSGPIEGKVNADKTGYVPGEFIKANGSIENLSNSDMPGSHFSIVQMVTQHATMKSRTVPVELVKAPGIPCNRRSTVQLSPQTLQVPAVPPSHLRFCKIIQVEYFLQLCVDTASCHINLRVKAPLEIGTIPLRDAGTGQPATASVMVNTAETSFQPLASVSANQPPTYQPPPPSYAAANSVTIPQKSGYEGPTTYAPQYNYYDWSQSAFTYN